MNAGKKSINCDYLISPLLRGEKVAAAAIKLNGSQRDFNILMDRLLQRTDQHKMCQWSLQDGKKQNKIFIRKIKTTNLQFCVKNIVLLFTFKNYNR